MKFMKRTLTLACAAGLLFSASAFDWPQALTQTEDFYSYFGQLRGDAVSSSLIFNESAEVTSCGDGDVLVVINEHDRDFGWFESPLGNTVIVGHKDSLVSVYANLEEYYVSESPSSVIRGQPLGVSGGSSWQDGSSALELIFLDTKNGTAVNPFIILPRLKNEIPLKAENVRIVSRTGTVYDAARTRYLSQGAYSLIMKRPAVSVPYKIETSLNGIKAEVITDDVLTVDGGKLCIKGNRNYSRSEFYTGGERSADSMLLGNVYITRGHNEILIIISDILGNTRTEKFVFDTGL